MLYYLLTLSMFYTIFNVVIVDLKPLIVCYVVSSSSTINEFVKHQLEYFIEKFGDVNPILHLKMLFRFF